MGETPINVPELSHDGYRRQEYQPPPFNPNFRAYVSSKKVKYRRVSPPVTALDDRNYGQRRSANHSDINKLDLKSIRIESINNSTGETKKAEVNQKDFDVEQELKEIFQRQENLLQNSKALLRAENNSF